jgi:regulator of sigma E protease
MNYIIPFFILITVVVFIHEYGHYYFAKKYGVGITDFSIGFGKEIFGWNDKSGTRWKVCWIPLGGYVKFFGDRNVFSEPEQREEINKYNDENRKKLFILKPLYQRSIIVAAGPLANFVLAILIFATINMTVGKDMTPAVINEVQEDSPAFVAGMKKNDKIISIDNKKVESILEVSIFINTSTSETIEFLLLRNNLEISMLIKPNLVEGKDSLGNPVKKRIIGIKLSPLNNEFQKQPLGLSKAIYYSVKEVWFVAVTTLN